MDIHKCKRMLEQIQDIVEDCLACLDKKTAIKKTNVKADVLSQANQHLDFSAQIRAFIKKHGKGKSGPKKFVLLLAYLSKGDLHKVVGLSEIEKSWNRMHAKNLLGMKFNRYYSVVAKENDWVESKKKGEYNLRPAWDKIV